MLGKKKDVAQEISAEVFDAAPSQAPKEEPKAAGWGFGKKPQAPPPPPPPPPSPSEERVKLLIDLFARDYDGVIVNGTDNIRAGLLFATYGELYALVESQNETNRLLEKVLKTLESMRGQ